MHQIGFSPGPTAALADRADGKEAPPPPGKAKDQMLKKKGRSSSSSPIWDSP